MPISCRTNSRQVRAVVTYEEVLKGYGNPQEEMQDEDQTIFDTSINPMCPQKLQAIVLDTMAMEQNDHQTLQYNNNTQITDSTLTNTVTQDTLAEQL
eukprot:1351540-Ditylum_brightwellii.AAC.1